MVTAFSPGRGGDTPGHWLDTETLPPGRKRNRLLAQVSGIHGPLKPSHTTGRKLFAGDCKHRAKCVALLRRKSCCFCALLCYVFLCVLGEGSNHRRFLWKTSVWKRAIGDGEYIIKQALQQHYNCNLCSCIFSPKACFVTDSTKTETRAEKEQQFKDLKINPPWTAAHVCVRKHFSLSSRASGRTGILTLL